MRPQSKIKYRIVCIAIIVSALLLSILIIALVKPEILKDHGVMYIWDIVICCTPLYIAGFLTEKIINIYLVEE
jgi:hypothetical protein